MFNVFKWNGFSALVTVVLGVVQLPLLTLFVDKSEFAGIGVALAIFSVLQIMSDGGIMAEVVREKDLTPEKFLDISSRVFLMVAAVSLGCFFLATILIIFSEKKIIGYILCIYAIVIFMNGLVIPIRGLLIKHEEFKKLSAVEILYCITQFCVSIFVAAVGGGALSISLGALFACFIQFFCINFIVSKLFYEFSIIKKINFKKINVKANKKSINIAFGEVIAAISSQVDVIISGLIFPPGEMGFYIFAKNICIRLQFLVTPAVNKIVLSRAAKNVNLGHGVSKIFIEATNMVIILNSIIFCSLFFVAELFVKYFLSSSWVGVDSVIKIMCIWALLRCVYTPIGAFLAILNRGGDLILFNIFILTLLGVSVGVSFFLGVIFLPFSVIIAYFFASPFYFYFVVNKIFKVDLWGILKLISPLIFLVSAMSWLYFFGE